MPAATRQRRGSLVARRALRWVAACTGLLLSVCGEPPSGPATGAGRAARLSFAPLMNQVDRAVFSLVASTIDNVHLVLRNATGAMVLDTVVAFPPGQDSVVVGASVDVHGESEHFGVRFELRSGTTTMFEGTQDLTARPGVNAAAPATVPLVFVGPGARAARVTVTPATSTLLAGATTTLSAVVADSAGAPISGAVIVWSSSNETSATVSATGVVTALGVRGSVTITARTPTGVSGSASVGVTLPPSKIVVKGGDAQTGTVATALAQPFVVQAQASDGVGVANVTVTFAATAPGATVSAASVTTDASGNASTALTLGSATGKQAFTASATALSAVSVTATATRDAASAIAIVSGDAQADTIGKALKSPFAVRVADKYGNAAAGASVTWRRVSGTGTLAAATSTTDSTGEARVGYQLSATPGTETVNATITGVAGSGVNFTATARSRPASRIVYVDGSDQTGTVGTSVQKPLIVRATDDLGNTVAGANIAWVITSNGALSTSTTTSDSLGLSQATATYPTVPGTFFVVARPAGSTIGGAQFQLLALVGAPAKVTIAAGDGQSGPGGTAVPIAPSVSVTDKYGNVNVGVSVTFTPSSGGSVTGSPATTNASGIATLGSWVLGPSAGGQTLTAASGTVSVTFTATATAVAPPVLSVAQQPSATVNNTQLFATQPKVQLKTAGGVSNKATAGVVITVALKTAGPALRGTLTATTDGTGLATFTNLSLKGTKGTNVLMFSASGYTGDTSATFKILFGPAISMAASSATALSGIVNTVASPNPTAFVTDSSGNGVGGVSVTFAVADTADGSVLGGAAVTDTTGHASPTSWTIGRGVRADTLTATSAGLAGSPVRFIATATAGAATQLVRISGDAQTGVTGNPLALPMVVEARDALSNPVAGVSIGFTAIAGGGSPSTQIVATDALGRAGFTLTLGAPGADSVKACLPSCATAQVLFSALSIPVGADAIWSGSASNAWNTAANWSPAVVPGGANKVFIPAGTPNGPVLGGNASVTDLTMAAGATLDVGTSQLSLGGALLSTGATMSGSTGYVYFCGGTHQVSGGVTGMVVDCGATVTAAGSVTIAGQLTAQGSAVFDVGTANVATTGTLTLVNASGARLKMTNPTGVLTVNGDAYFNAVDMYDTDLTAGTLQLKGNFTAQSNNYTSFRAKGTHLTRFIGSSPQAIYFYYPEFGKSQFANLEFAGNNTVTLNSNVFVEGTTNVAGTTVIVSSAALVNYGRLTAASGTNMSGLANLSVVGPGDVFPLILGLGPANVYLGSSAINAPAGTTTLPTNLTVTSGATLDIGASNLTITGGLTLWNASGARLKMNNSLGVLTVNGDAYFNASDMYDVDLTAGTLQIGGNFTAQSNNYTAFRAKGTHLTRFVGSGPQSVYLYYSSYSQSQFMNLEFAGNNTVTLSSNVFVEGTTNITGTTTVASGNALVVNGLLTATSGTSMSGLVNLSVTGNGNIFPLVLGSGPANVYLSGGSTNAPAGTTTLPTNLTVTSGATLDIGTSNLTVTGGLTLWSASGAHLKMNNALGVLTVNGDAYFNASDMNDVDLTAGTLQIKGNFTAQSNNYTSFRAKGTHLTRFIGSGPQAIYFYYPNFGQSQFANLEFAGNNTVTLSSNVFVESTTNITGTTAIVSSAALVNYGRLTAASGTNMSGLANLSVVGPGDVFPLILGVGPANVYLGSSLIAAPAGTTTLPTNLTVTSGATLDIGTSNLMVTGGLTLWSASGAHLKMNNALGVLTVTGDAYFNASDMYDVDLTAGTLQIGGNFTAQSNNYTSFRATGSHLTRFNGSGAQSLYMYYNGGGQSQFANIEITNLLGNVTPSSNIIIAGNLNQLGHLSWTSVTVSVGGAVTLGPSSTTTVSGGFNKPAGCSILSGSPSFSGFSCP